MIRNPEVITLAIYIMRKDISSSFYFMLSLIAKMLKKHQMELDNQIQKSRF